jgi:hypothetical protein
MQAASWTQRARTGRASLPFLQKIIGIGIVDVNLYLLLPLLWLGYPVTGG